jgi:hypothetical protein
MTRGRFVSDWSLGRPAILGREHDRLGDRIRAVGELHAHRAGQLACGLELSDRVAGAGQRGERTVGAIGVGLHQAARPGVVAAGRDKEAGRLRGVGRQRPDVRPEHRANKN